MENQGINRHRSPLIRLFDLIFALSGIIITSPIFLIIVILGFLDTGSPIFVQNRVGQNKQPFKLFKFRTMSLDTASVATHLVSKSSVTKLGGLLRKTKLDELPQLYNVLRGEMSMVGPRPCLSNQQELINERFRRDVYSVPPGITGLAQINNIDMSTPKLLSEPDQKMIQELTLSKYFKYIILTVFGRGQGDKIL